MLKVLTLIVVLVGFAPWGEASANGTMGTGQDPNAIGAIAATVDESCRFLTSSDRGVAGHVLERCKRRGLPSKTTGPVWCAAPIALTNGATALMVDWPAESFARRSWLFLPGHDPAPDRRPPRRLA
jgi:hypothetical protein